MFAKYIDWYELILFRFQYKKRQKNACLTISLHFIDDSNFDECLDSKFFAKI